MEYGARLGRTFFRDADPHKSFGENLLVYHPWKVSSHKDHYIIGMIQGVNPDTVCSHARLCRRLVSPNSLPPARNTHRDIRTHYRWGLFSRRPW